MSDQFEVDTDELVEQLGEHQRLTGTEPKDESSGMTRRDLLMRGGAAAAAVSGVGALAGAAAAAPAKTGAFTGTLACDHARRRVADARGSEEGGGRPRLQVRPDRDRPGHDGPEGDHGAGDVRHLRRLQLPGHPDVVVASPDAHRHQEDHGLASAVQAVRVRQGPPRRERRDLRRRRRPVPGALPEAGHDGPAADEGLDRSRTRTSSSGWSTSAPTRPGARCPGTSSARRRTSTRTRSATTPTSSRSCRTRSAGPSS